MSADLDALLKLEVPVIVLLGRRAMPVREVTSLVPGAIIELPKSAEEDLELLANNKPIGLGRAVKVGENFGLRMTFVGDLRKRLEAAAGGDTRTPEEIEADRLAEQMLAGQV
jgi:flagellar motor switch protein FliN/FliY